MARQISLLSIGESPAGCCVKLGPACLLDLVVVLVVIKSPLPLNVRGGLGPMVVVEDHFLLER